MAEGAVWKPHRHLEGELVVFRRDGASEPASSIAWAASGSVVGLLGRRNRNRKDRPAGPAKYAI